MGVLQTSSALVARSAYPPSKEAFHLGQWAASIAHEVNQPLAAIVTNAESCLLWLENDQLDLKRARMAAERIVRDGYHASAILKSIRAIFRKGSSEFVAVDINGVIKEVIGEMQDEFDRKDVVVEVDLCSNAVSVLGDKVQLCQVLMNLIRNGIESMNELTTRPRWLRVSTSLEIAGFATVAVTDSGVGIAAVAVNQIFEPFYTTKREGVGIGLWICRSIVEAHGGLLWAARGVPHGSVFQFKVPTGVERGQGTRAIRGAR